MKDFDVSPISERSWFKLPESANIDTHKILEYLSKSEWFDYGGMDGQLRGYKGIGLTSRSSRVEDEHDSLAVLQPLGNHSPTEIPDHNWQEISHWNKNVFGSIQNFFENLSLPPLRSRFSKLAPRTSIPNHVDEFSENVTRLHWPIVTDESNYFCFYQNGRLRERFHMAAGHCYAVNTNCPHGFVNLSKTVDRIHLIVNVGLSFNKFSNWIQSHSLFRDSHGKKLMHVIPSSAIFFWINCAAASTHLQAADPLILVVKLPPMSSWVQPLYGFPKTWNDPLSEIDSANLIILKANAGHIEANLSSEKLKMDAKETDAFFQKLKDRTQTEFVELPPQPVVKCSPIPAESTLWESIPEVDKVLVDQVLCLNQKAQPINQFLFDMFSSANLLNRPTFVIAISEKGPEILSSARSDPLRLVLVQQVPLFIYVNRFAKKIPLYKKVLQWQRAAANVEDLPNILHFLDGTLESVPVLGQKNNKCMDSSQEICKLKNKLDLNRSHLVSANKRPLLFSHQSDSWLRLHLALQYYKRLEIDIHYDPGLDEFWVRHNRASKTNGIPLSNVLKKAFQGGAEQIWLDWKNSEAEPLEVAERRLTLLIANAKFTKRQILIERNIWPGSVVKKNRLKDWFTTVSVRKIPVTDIPRQDFQPDGTGISFASADRKKYEFLIRNIATPLYTWFTSLDPLKDNFEKQLEGWSDYSGIILLWPETFWNHYE